MELYESLLNEITPRLAFGTSAIHVYRPSELKSGQVGYSMSPDGKSLVGDNDGDWRGTWLVIGYDETCGEPIFIDKSVQGYPVYTAANGKGRWDSVPIAISLQAFGQSLAVVAAIAKGREYPMALEQNPLPEAEREAALATIRRHNPGISLDFWRILLSE